VHGYTQKHLGDLAAGCGMRIERLLPLGGAGFLVMFGRD
jgi:hypothetical protein